MQMFLNEQQVKDLIKEAERFGEVIVVRCIRKTKASKSGGPDAGDLYDLHCGTKPAYTPVSGRDRRAEDSRHGILTVWATNRQKRTDRTWGDWRRVNIRQVQKVIYKGTEYEVVTS